MNILTELPIDLLEWLTEQEEADEFQATDTCVEMVDHLWQLATDNLATLELINTFITTCMGG